MSYESDVEAENARLRAREKEWQAAAGGLEEPGMLALAVNHQTAILEKSQDRERTALRERDEARTACRIAEQEERNRAGVLRMETQRADRAEADCAAMREVLQRMRGPRPAEEHSHSAQAFMRWWTDIERGADEALARPGGSALLERHAQAVALLQAQAAAYREVLETVVAPGHASRIRAVLAQGAGEAMLERLRATEEERDDARRDCDIINAANERLRAAKHEAILAETMLKVLGATEQDNVVSAAAAILDRLSAAVAVVEAARNVVVDAETVGRVDARESLLREALAAYDALGAKGEASEVLCEHGAGEGVECYVCHPKAVGP